MTPTPHPGRLLIDEAEAAEMLGVSRVTLRNWRRAGTAPEHVELGPRLIRYTREAVLDYIKIITRKRGTPVAPVEKPDGGGPAGGD
jgi:predicted DNA-binding transcriptional regulator AlpA